MNIKQQNIKATRAAFDLGVGMETEVPFNGTPHDFCIVAREFSGEPECTKGQCSFSLKAPAGWFWTQVRGAMHGTPVSPWFTPETNPVSVYVCSSVPPIIDGKRDDLTTYGEIKAQKTPDGKSQLRLYPDGRYLREFQQGWSLLRAEMEHQRWIDAQPTANQVDGEQRGLGTQKEPTRKRIFGLRTEYLIAAIILGILISIASLFLFPDWGLSIRALVILFPLAFAGVTNFIANFRKAFE